MRIVLRGRRTGLLWLTTGLCVIGISMAALTVVFTAVFGSPIPSAAQVKAQVQLVQATLWTPHAAAALDAIEGYQAGERAALRTLDEGVLAQLPVFAQGAALDAVIERVRSLRAAGRWQELAVPEFEVVQIVENEPDLYVTTREVLRLDEYAAGGAGAAPSAPTESSVAAWEVVYRLVYAAGRWRVAEVSAVKIAALPAGG